MALLSPAAEQVLNTYRKRLALEQVEMREQGGAGRRDDFLLPVGEEVGEVLGSLIVAGRAKTIVEVGSSYGFSTLFLASAASRIGGMLHSIEIHPQKQSYARDRIDEAGLSDFVQWHLGDALDMIDLVPGPFDFVLIDLWKELYIPCLQHVVPKLASNGMIAADNILLPEIHRADGEKYRAAVRMIPNLESVLLPIGAGIELSCARA